MQFALLCLFVKFCELLTPTCWLRNPIVQASQTLTQALRFKPHLLEKGINHMLKPEDGAKQGTTHTSGNDEEIQIDNGEEKAKTNNDKEGIDSVHEENAPTEAETQKDGEAPAENEENEENGIKAVEEGCNGKGGEVSTEVHEIGKIEEKDIKAVEEGQGRRGLGRGS